MDSPVRDGQSARDLFDQIPFPQQIRVFWNPETENGSVPSEVFDLEVALLSDVRPQWDCEVLVVQVRADLTPHTEDTPIIMQGSLTISDVKAFLEVDSTLVSMIMSVQNDNQVKGQLQEDELGGRIGRIEVEKDNP